jgi:hypothetical protein
MSLHSANIEPRRPEADNPSSLVALPWLPRPSALSTLITH